MILVAVGQTRGFPRLVKKMDQIAGEIDEKVIMQIGYTNYYPKNSEFFYFEKYSRIEELNREARIIVSHAGVGSILTAIRQGTPIIIMPRLKKYGEAIDDHQLEISEVLSGNPCIIVVHLAEELEQYFKTVIERRPTETNIKFLDNRGNNKLTDSIKAYLSSLY